MTNHREEVPMSRSKSASKLSESKKFFFLLLSKKFQSRFSFDAGREKFVDPLSSEILSLCHHRRRRHCRRRCRHRRRRRRSIDVDIWEHPKEKMFPRKLDSSLRLVLASQPRFYL